MNPDVLLDDIDAALDAAAEAPLWALTPNEQVNWAARMLSVQARAQALAGTGLVTVDQADLSQFPGRAAKTVIAAQTKARPADVVFSLNLARWAQQYPVFEHAAAAGELTVSHLRVLRAVDNPRTCQHLADAQEYLVDAATGCEWDEFVAVLRYWVLAFDPDGEEPDEQHAERKLSMHKNSDGTVSGKFFLDPVDGHALITAIERHAKRLADEDKAEGRDRTASQRKADALVELIMKGVASGQRVPEPLVHIVLGAVTVADAFGRLDPDGPEPCGHDDQACGHDNGGPHGTSLNHDPEPPEPATAGEPTSESATGEDEQAAEHPDTGTHDTDESGASTADGTGTEDAEPSQSTEPGDGGGHSEDADLPDPDDPEAEADWLWDGNPPPPLEPEQGNWGRPHRPRRQWPPDRLPLNPRDPERRSEFVDGTPVHPKAVMGLLANAVLRRLVLSADGEVLDLSRAERFFPLWLKQALLAAGRGRCATPGCDGLLAWLEADHYRSWNRGGGTAVKNGQILCSRCNKVKADGPPEAA